jgi:spore coat protein CotF
MDAQNTVDKVWQLHLDDFVKYAVADKSGDQAGKTAALTDINNNYTKPLAQYLAKANPNLPEATLESELNDHIQMTAQMIDYHVQGNYTAEANELNMANTHIAGLFNTLANAIIKQYPNKFQ